MSLWSPRNILAVIGTMLFLIALYLVLTNFVGAERILGTLSTASTGLVSTLQGRGS